MRLSRSGCKVGKFISRYKSVLSLVGDCVCFLWIIAIFVRCISSMPVTSDWELVFIPLQAIIATLGLAVCSAIMLNED